MSPMGCLNETDQYMKMVIEEAKISLCERNNGFGTVIVKDGALKALAHDGDKTENDPSSAAYSEL